MRRADTPHPDEQELQSYYDEELAASRQEQLRRHFEGCELCGSRLRALQELSQQMRALQPQPQALRSEGEFWSRLASRFEPERPPVWPWTRLLTPLALSLLGLPLQALIGIVVVLSAVAGLGLLPPLWTAQVSQSWLLRGLADLVERTMPQVARSWAGMSVATRDALALTAVVLALGVLLLVVTALYMSWVMLWTRSRSGLKGGNRSWTTDASSDGR